MNSLRSKKGCARENVIMIANCREYENLPEQIIRDPTKHSIGLLPKQMDVASVLFEIVNREGSARSSRGGKSVQIYGLTAGGIMVTGPWRYYQKKNNVPLEGGRIHE